MRDLFKETCIRIVRGEKRADQGYEVDENESEGRDDRGVVPQETQVDEAAIGNLLCYVEALFRLGLVQRGRAVSLSVLLHLTLLLAFKTYTRVEPGQGEVRQKVADDERQGQHDQNAAREVDVLAEQGIEQQGANKGQRQYDGDDR